MKTYNEIQEQIKVLDKIIANHNKELALPNSYFMSEKIKKQISTLQSEINTLKWVLS